MSSPTQYLEAALQYAGRGWRVFPLHSVWHKDAATAVCTCKMGEECPSKGKHPRIKDGVKGASSDPAVVAEWWNKWPQANIGIATGDGLTVLDVDGSEGQKELFALIEKHPGNFPVTLACRTGNGGHFYWALRGPRSTAKGHLHSRGEGGYVVAPPSLHASGRHYTWVNDIMPAVPPAWLVNWFAGARPREGATTDVGATSATRDKGATGQKALTISGARPDYLARHHEQFPKLVDAAAIDLPWSAHEEARLRSALDAIPPTIDGQTWATIGFALHALEWIRNDGSDIGLDIWDDWSRQAPPQGRGEGLGLYRGRADLEKRWDSFSRTTYAGPRVTVATIYHEAGLRGWSGQILRAPAPEAPVNGATNGHTFPFTSTSPVVGGPIFVDLDRHGRPKPTCVNSRLALGALGVTCRHDLFHDRLEVGGRVMQQWAGELTDNAVHVLRGLIHHAYRFDPGTVACYDAAVQECLANSYDPVLEYLDGLTWDRKPRLANWLQTYMGAEDTALNRAIGILGLTAAVRRARQPGAKFDNITVLVSGEGYGKSSAIEILAGESCFSDQPILGMDERAQQEAMQGVWLYEIADLAGMSKADVDRTKAFASRRIDRARPAYARARIDRPRRCVFFGTTNLTTFLKSQTGNRRFWPVQVARVKVDEIARDRDQIWAEASAVERTGVPLALHESLWRAAGEVQAARMEHDPWDDILSHITCKEDHKSSCGRGWEWRVSSRDVLEHYLGLPVERMTDVAAKRAAFVMRRLGWEGPKVIRVGDTTQRGFTKLLKALR